MTVKDLFSARILVDDVTIFLTTQHDPDEEDFDPFEYAERWTTYKTVDNPSTIAKIIDAYGELEVGCILPDYASLAVFCRDPLR